MARLAAGERAALRVLYERHAPRMLGLGVRVLGDRHDAEEVLGDVFLELWTRRDRFDAQRGSPHAYLTLLMRSRCLDRARANTSRSKVGGATDPALLENRGGGYGASASPDARLLEAERREGLGDAMADLPETSRAALRMAFYDGLSHREIADTTGKPLGTIKSHLRTGLIRLRDRLRSDEQKGASR